MTGGRRRSSGSSSSENMSSTQAQSRSPSGDAIAHEKIDLVSAAAGEAKQPWDGEQKVLGSYSDSVASQTQIVVDKRDQEPVGLHSFL